MRNQFNQIMLEIAEHDEKAVMLIGDISHHLLKDYEKRFPDRFYNLGICEQTLVGLASGLAMQGLRPVVHTIAPFCVERAYEQIKIDLCYQKTDVTIVSVGSSFDYAHLGCTHHCYEDVAILRALPNIQIFVPGTSEEFKTLFTQTWGNGYPKYFKLSNKQHGLKIKVDSSSHTVVRRGSGNIVIFVNGHLLDEVMQASTDEDTVVYLPVLSGLSETSKSEIATIVANKKVLIVEENAMIGGLGDLIFDISSKFGVPISAKKIGIPNKFLTNYGKPEQHREALGLTVENIKKCLMEIKCTI